MRKTPEQLLTELTLDEKLAQLVALGSPSDLVRDKKFNRELAAERYPHGLFGLMVPIDLTPSEIGEWARDMFSYFESVSVVPPVLMCESLHGILGMGTTVFPQSIGLGSSFDPELAERIGRAIGEEARALGIRLSLAPDLDLGREPRWGRLEETYGEDSYLVGRMGEAYIKGLLGEDKKYAATVKHFAAHGSPKSGVNLSSVTVTEQELWDKYLPPFEKALRAGALCVMPAYSALNGVPCHANPILMNNILREKLGFDGVVISDFGGIEMLTFFQCAAEDKKQAAKLSVSCGIDIEAPGAWAYGEALKQAISDGEIAIEDVDKMVLRVLKLKEALGLYEMPKPDLDHIKSTVRSEAHRALAREAAEKSIVLLKNDGVLPLKNGTKIAVIGPNAFSTQLGDYALPKFDVPTPETAIRARAESMGGSVVTAKGCDVYGTDTSGFAEAIDASESADVTVLIIGGKSMKGYGVGWGSEEESILTCGEGCDMHDLVPGGPQLDLARALIATGKPVVIVSIDGRPETLLDVADSCGAWVNAWYPGEEGSLALASLLFGDCNFSAKLPVTFPKHTGQLPLCYDNVLSDYGFYHSPGTVESPGRDYVFTDTKPTFPFGHGIGYAKLVYRDLAVSYDGKDLAVAVTVENVGECTATETVSVYVRDEVATIPQPVKKLAAIQKVTLKAKEAKIVHLTVPNDALMLTNLYGNRVLEPGWFTVMTDALSARIFI